MSFSSKIVELVVDIVDTYRPVSRGNIKINEYTQEIRGTKNSGQVAYYTQLEQRCDVLYHVLPPT